MNILKACGLISLLSLNSIALANNNHEVPLLMEGKSTLYERVLTTPSCLLHQKDDLSDSGKSITAFTQYYVYKPTSEKSLRVGSNATGKVVGYLNKNCTVAWRQQLALLFTNAANREQALIFDKESALDYFIDNDNSAAEYKALQSEVVKNKSAKDVISIEPKEYIDYTKNFYLLPILNSSESIFPDGSYVYKHQIASITSDKAKASSTVVNKQKAQGEPAIVGFKSAVVFVIDSSISMQPYIDRTKKAINTIYKSIEKANLNDSVQFGIISFRANTNSVPALEYTTKIYLRPGEAHSAQEFNAKVNALTQAKASSSQFNEDAYAGINQALQEINWQEYGGRYVVLITDAGAIDAHDSESSTKLDAKALRLEAEHNGVAIYALHLLTNGGKKNHASAKSQYENLSFNSVLNKPLYYGVNAGDVNAFGNMVDSLARSLTSQVALANQGQLSAGSALAAKDNAQEENKDLQALESDTSRLGYAMQLAYLGRVKGTKAPDFLTGWLSDRDIVDHNQVVATPIVLVNRNQLSDLYTLVKGVLQSGIAGQLSSDDMFAQLQALAAQMGRDPNLLSKSKTISEMGIMGELLDDLPYKSKIASLSPDDWYNLGSQEQESIVRSLENSLTYLQQCASDNDRFIKLNQDADALEEVYPIPLEALP